MKTILPLFFCSAIVVAALLALRGASRTRELAAAETASTAELNGLRAKTVAMSERLRRAENARMDLEKNISAAEAERAATAAKAAGAARRINPEAAIANDPKKLAEYSKDFREALDLKYGAMWKAVGLSAEQFEEFKAFKLRSEHRRLDRIAAAYAQRLRVNSQVFRALQESDMAEEARHEAEIFGDRHEQYHEYHRTESLRGLVRRFATHETWPEAPLTSAQVEQVVRILAEHSQRQPTQAVIPGTIDWQSASPRLQSLVSPGALAVLRSNEQGVGLTTRSQKEINRILAPFKAAANTR